MEQQVPTYLLALIPILFIVFFSLLWLSITSLLGALSGWFHLHKSFPDRPDEQAVLRLRGQTGMMGGLTLMPVNFKHCLRLDACPSGLRVGLFKLLGPFQRPFFVPWPVIAVAKGRRLFGSHYRLAFGLPEQGALTLSASTAEKLAETGLLRLPDAPEGIPSR